MTTYGVALTQALLDHPVEADARRPTKAITPIQTTGPTGDAEREIARREADLDKPRSETDDPRNPFEDRDLRIGASTDMH